MRFHIPGIMLRRERGVSRDRSSSDQPLSDGSVVSEKSIGSSSNSNGNGNGSEPYLIIRGAFGRGKFRRYVH